MNGANRSSTGLGCTHSPGLSSHHFAASDSAEMSHCADDRNGNAAARSATLLPRRQGRFTTNTLSLR